MKLLSASLFPVYANEAYGSCCVPLQKWCSALAVGGECCRRPRAFGGTTLLLRSQLFSQIMISTARLRNEMMSLSFVSFIFIVVLHVAPEVSGHGRLVEPPSRSSMWRFGFKSKPNYNDNELFCGGYTVQWQRNGGKCGVCGDPWHAPTPRPNEAGGIYGRGIIVRKYKPGQVIKTAVDITANHRGFFEFKLCPHNSPSTVVSQECLDQHLLEMADGSGNRYYPSAGTGLFTVHLKLPEHLKCTQCVFQWTYTAGNNWGTCENGSSKVGCGPQETFRGCADVAIDDSGSNDIPSYNDIPLGNPSISAVPTRRSTFRPRTRPTRPSRRPYYKQRPTATRGPYTRPSKPTPYYSKPNRKYTTRRPSYTRPTVTRRPSNWPSRPTQYYNVPDRKYTTRRPTYTTRRRPTYTRPTPYRPMYTPEPTPYRPVFPKETSTKKPGLSYKPKPAQKKPSSIESETGGRGGCRAVGVWQSISGIASWCDSNCARGYCPSTHCDCS